LFHEAEHLDFDGRFDEVMQEKMRGLRTDKLLWVQKHVYDESLQGEHKTPLHLTLSYCPSLHRLFSVLFSLPFELNKKTALGLQLTDVYCLDCFSASTFFKVHKDGGFGDYDTGRKITAIYTISREGPIRLKFKGVEVELQHDSLVLLKARLVDYEILPSPFKFFLAVVFIPGPCDSHQ
jgi:hypothetical protein